jgi:hypothetical protein
MNNLHKKLIRDNIIKLNCKETYIKIYNILKYNDVKLNINNNGIYFDLNSINCDVLKEIENIVNLNIQIK